ncbi:plasmid SOS inhibition protein A [Citrobacter freundii complex sp. 2022EL-00972]|nr:plasmid SOS inhibition protein A [Citrobacter freundii complex sp. 2022EL-00972]
MTAIAKIEARISAGRSLPEYPYAKAFFRELSGKNVISALDIRLVDSAYDPSVRGGSTKTDYIKAIDIMIESRGEQWILPLSKSVIVSIFPASSVRQIQRRDHREQIILTRSERRSEQQKQERMFVAENTVDSDVSDQRFRRYPISDSDIFRSPIPVISDHPLAHLLARF